MGRRTRRCADGPTVPGIDVSSWQGRVDWQKIAASGVKYAFIRAFDGRGADREFRRNWEGAKAAGLLRGAYTYFRARHSGEMQARLMLEVLRGDPGELPPVLDLETDDGQTTEKTIAEVRAWVRAMKAGLGRDPMLYAGSFWHFSIAPHAGDEFSHLALWTPHYTDDPCPGVPDGWTRWTFWQTTNRGLLPGIRGNVDMNVFNGDEAALQRFAGRGRGRGRYGWLVGAVLSAAVIGGAWWWFRGRRRAKRLRG